MSVFNFMESFFFISLGVTFILILLLVYHFKQRLTMVENKADTMVDIMNNMVKEMGIIKNLATSQISRNFQPQQQQMFPHTHTPTPTPTSHLDVSNRILVSENDEDDSEDDSDSESEDESESEEDSEDNSESDSESEIEDEDEDDSKDIDVSEDININTVVAEEKEENNEIKTEELIQNTDIDIEVVDVDVIDEVKETVNIAENVNSEEIDANSEDYTKMSLSQLKTLVVAKGLVNDASKMKKKHMVDLLMSNLKNVPN